MPKTITLLAALLTVAGSRANAQTITPGQLAERITSATDSTQSYAVYLPAAYTSARRWPIMYIMDPRGRALIPIRRMISAAERHGYILVSSYNTLSDGDGTVNVVAMNAMLSDMNATVSIDPRRTYLVGFSGTARVAWNFADQLEGTVAGILGAGASGALNVRLQEIDGAPPKVAFFGVTGVADFNYDELRAFEPWLIGNGAPYRLRRFDGGHAWPPEELFTEAIEWFELQAMRAQQRPVDRALAESMCTANADAARTFEAEGKGADALERWQEIVRDCGDIAPVADAQQRVAALERDRRVRRELALQVELRDEFRMFNRRLGEWLAAARRESRPPNVSRAVDALDIDRIARIAADTAAGERARAAQRKLEQAFVLLYFYEPRAHMAAGRPEHALALADLALRVKPGAPAALLTRARALVALERNDDALAALEAAIQAGILPAAVAGDADFAPLRQDARFQALVGG